MSILLQSLRDNVNSTFGAESHLQPDLPVVAPATTASQRVAYLAESGIVAALGYTLLRLAHPAWGVFFIADGAAGAIRSLVRK